MRKLSPVLHWLFRACNIPQNCTWHQSKIADILKVSAQSAHFFQQAFSVVLRPCKNQFTKLLTIVNNLLFYQSDLTVDMFNGREN